MHVLKIQQAKPVNMMNLPLLTAHVYRYVAVTANSTCMLSSATTPLKTLPALPLHGVTPYLLPCGVLPWLLCAAVRAAAEPRVFIQVQLKPECHCIAHAHCIYSKRQLLCCRLESCQWVWTVKVKFKGQLRLRYRQPVRASSCKTAAVRAAAAAAGCSAIALAVSEVSFKVVWLPGITAQGAGVQDVLQGWCHLNIVLDGLAVHLQHGGKQCQVLPAVLPRQCEKSACMHWRGISMHGARPEVNCLTLAAPGSTLPFELDSSWARAAVTMCSAPSPISPQSNTCEQ
jgi:hypothetical protein